MKHYTLFWESWRKMKLNRGNYTTIFYSSTIYRYIMVRLNSTANFQIKIQISCKDFKIYFFFSWYFVVRSNMILSFITRFVWPEKGNNRTWIAFSINIEQELLNISFFYIFNLSIYDYRIYWKSVKHFIFFLFCPFF